MTGCKCVVEAKFGEIMRNMGRKLMFLVIYWKCTGYSTFVSTGYIFSFEMNYNIELLES